MIESVANIENVLASYRLLHEGQATCASGTGIDKAKFNRDKSAFFTAEPSANCWENATYFLNGQRTITQLFFLRERDKNYLLYILCATRNFPAASSRVTTSTLSIARDFLFEKNANNVNEPEELGNHALGIFGDYLNGL